MLPTTGSRTETIRVARTEAKYRVRAEELPALRSWLLRYCVPDENSQGGDWYAIRSLYLDNDGYRMYHDAQQKLAYRLKLRARAYGDATGSVKLEVKRRLRDQIVKTSATLRPEQWAAVTETGLSGLHGLGKASAGEFLQFAESLRAEPKMLVYYERQAFSSVVDEYVRVTFDRNVMCQPVREWDLMGDPRAWLSVDGANGFGERESTFILEVKFMDSPPAWLRDLVLTFGLQRRGGSKYVKAMKRGMFYREAAWDMVGAA